MVGLLLSMCNTSQSPSQMKIALPSNTMLQFWEVFSLSFRVQMTMCSVAFTEMWHTRDTQFSADTNLDEASHVSQGALISETTGQLT